MEVPIFSIAFTKPNFASYETLQQWGNQEQAFMQQRTNEQQTGTKFPNLIVTNKITKLLSSFQLLNLIEKR
jgi:translation elongation factor EF-Ts